MPSRPRCRHSPRPFALVGLLLALAVFARPTAAGAAAWDDPLAPLVQRMDRYLQLYQADGVTMDWRYSVSPSEEIRQTVVCQLLAYVELYRLYPRTRLWLEVSRHADFMLGRLADIRSHSPFDGMLAYSLLGAYETTRQTRFLDAGSEITQEMLAIPTSQCVLNGGLMVAMATAEYARLTGSTVATQKTHDIVAQLVPYQNADGSFPHWCFGSRDIHYTGWMAMELLHLRRMIADPHIDPFLASMNAFLEGRIDGAGMSVYQQPCGTGCTEYYYSRATGCSYDYDTRGWTVEPVYCALLFDHLGSPKYQPVMTFFDSLEDGGTIADLYGYWPPPGDPEYPWTIADTSVVCASIVFWALATQVADRVGRGLAVDLRLDDLIDTTSSVPPPPVAESRPLLVAPNPARGGCTLRFSLPAAAAGTLAIYDLAGRRLDLLESGALARGEHALRWDGGVSSGRPAPSGVYFARLRAADGRDETRRFVFVR
jgi:hypothetical protein